MMADPIGARALAQRNLIPSGFYEFVYAHMHTISQVSVDRVCAAHRKRRSHGRVATQIRNPSGAAPEVAQAHVKVGTNEPETALAICHHASLPGRLLCTSLSTGVNRRFFSLPEFAQCLAGLGFTFISRSDSRCASCTAFPPPRAGFRQPVRVCRSPAVRPSGGAIFEPPPVIVDRLSAANADETVFMLTGAMDWGYNHELFFYKPSFRVYS